MRIISVVLIGILMMGCSTNTTREVVEVKVPVYMKPKVEKIQRPTLISSENMTEYDEIIKTVKVNIESLTTYSTMLENQLNVIVDYSN